MKHGAEGMFAQQLVRTGAESSETVWPLVKRRDTESEGYLNSGCGQYLISRPIVKRPLQTQRPAGQHAAKRLV